jgi:hypothetical protein
VKGYPGNAIIKDCLGYNFAVLLSCSIFIAIPAMQYGEKMVCSFEINALALKTVIGKKVERSL